MTSLTMPMSDIVDALVKWNDSRTDLGATMGYLNNGVGFEIDKSIYTAMASDSPTYVHAYVGVIDSGLWLFLIDDVQDAKNPDASHIFPIKYLPSLTSPIPTFDRQDDPSHQLSVTRGLERCFRWHLERYHYLAKTIGATYEPDLGQGLFQAFTIPFSDLEAIFNPTSSNEKAVVVFGLKLDDTTPSKQEVEFILWGDSFVAREILEDISLPVPPFKPTEPAKWQLLKTAGLTPH